MHKVYFLLGSNEGACAENLSKAIDEISKHIGMLLKVSSVYKTEPWGFESENFFLNQVICVETDMLADDVLKTSLDIEKSLGRKRTTDNYEPRTIDIDILFYDNDIIEKIHLKVPHPLISYRKFTLVPLNEIAPDLRHPVTNQTIGDILITCKDPTEVNKYD